MTPSMLVSGAMTMTSLRTGESGAWQGVGEALGSLPGLRDAASAAKWVRFAGIAVAVLAVVGIAVLLSKK